MQHLFEKKDYTWSFFIGHLIIEKLLKAYVSTFNIRARYDDYNLEFYKICTKEFSESWIEKITGLRKWIKEQL